MAKILSENEKAKVALREFLGREFEDCVGASWEINDDDGDNGNNEYYYTVTFPEKYPRNKGLNDLNMKVELQEEEEPKIFVEVSETIYYETEWHSSSIKYFWVCLLQEY